jgi:DNA-binding FadR family transcriptional regulator
MTVAVHVARAAADRAAPAEREALHAHVATLSPRGRSGVEQRNAADAAFHRLLIAAAHNHAVTCIAEPVLEGVRHAGVLAWRSLDLAAYDDLLEALDSGDPGRAERAMRAHVEAVAEATRGNRPRILARARRRHRERIDWLRREHAHSLRERTPRRS